MSGRKGRSGPPENSNASKPDTRLDARLSIRCRASDLKSWRRASRGKLNTWLIEAANEKAREL